MMKTMTVGPTSPALRAAVDASLSWYDALCALHGVPCGIEDDVWCAHAPPPPLHSNAKTIEPGARPDRALAAVRDRGSIADSFGEFDLRDEGYELLFEAQWVHRPPPATGSRLVPTGWERVRTEPQLRAWTSRHDTEAVLLPALLHRSVFRMLGKRDEGGYSAGAVLHVGTGAVSISNVWSASGLDWTELVDAAAAEFPGRALNGYERGRDLEDALAAGFTAVGPQRVWVR